MIFLKSDCDFFVIVRLNMLHFIAEVKAVAALLGVSGVSLYRGLTTKTKNVRGQILRSLCDSATVSVITYSLLALYYWPFC